MFIISHRGYWKNKNEKNNEIAFVRSYSHNYGTETDIRDYDGKLVISHDIGNSSCMSLEAFFLLYSRQKRTLPLALNIKSDGLQEMLFDLIITHKIENYFVFDMSIPDTIKYIENDMNVFIRQSEYEQIPVFYDKAKGIWLDAFNSDWWDINLIEEHLKNNKKVCIVSSELHGRNPQNMWKTLLNTAVIHDKNIILCTDCPEKAVVYFNE